MTERGDPPTYPGSGRSIYERLGLTPIPSKPLPRPIAVPARPASKRWAMYCLIVMFLGVALFGTGLLLDVGMGGQHGIATRGGEDEQRLDLQARQIALLELRVEMLEGKVRTLQQANNNGTEAHLVQPSMTPAPSRAPKRAAH